MVNECDVCGAIGRVKELVICSHCKNVFRHSYCMKDLLFKVPWCCDDCPQSLNMVQIQAENMPDNKVSNAEDNHQIKALLPLGNHYQRMANKLTSKDNILASNSKNDKRRSFEVSGCNRQTNKKATNPVQKNQLATRRKSMSDLGNTLPLQKMENLMTSEIKLKNYHDQHCWKGTFEIWDGYYFAPPFNGLRAHLSCDVKPKVVDLCKILPETIKFKKLPLSKIWPKIFTLEPPNTDDVAFYFFCDPGRPRDKYIRFVQLLDSRDHALKAKMKDARLLLFSSKKLPIDSQNTEIGSYLWGVVRYPKPKVPLENTNAKCTNSSTSVTKKQTMFKSSNIPPATKIVDIIVNPKTNVLKSCLIKKPTENISQVVSLGKQENEAECTLNPNIPPRFSKNSPKVRFDTRFDKLKESVDYYTDADDTDLPPGFSYLPSDQQMNAQLQSDCEKGNVVKNKDAINKASNMDCHECTINPNIAPSFSKNSPKVRFDTKFDKLKESVDYYTDVDDTDLPPGFSYPPSDQQMNAQLQTDCEKGNVVKNNDAMNKASNTDCHDCTLNPNIPPGFSKNSPKVRFDTRFDKLKESVDYYTDVDDTDLPPGFSYLPSDQQMNAQLQTDCEKGNVVKNNDAIDKVSNTDCHECTLNPNIPLGFSKNSPKIRFDTRFDKLQESVDYYTDVDDTDLPPGFSYPPSDQQVDGQLQTDSEKCNVVKNKDAIYKASNTDCHEDLIVPNIGAPPGFTKNPSKNVPLETTKADNRISELVNGTKDKGFIKDDGHMKNIGAPPGFPEITVSGHFVHPSKCNGSCLQEGKNGNCSVLSDVGVKVNMKSETLEYSAMHVVSEPCREDNFFVSRNFGQSSLSKDATSTMIKCQKAPDFSAEVTGNKKSSKSSVLRGQSLKSHLIRKNPALYTPPLRKNEGCSLSVDKCSTPSAEKVKDDSSKAVNPQSVSEVKRILLELQKQKEPKGKK